MKPRKIQTKAILCRKATLCCFILGAMLTACGGKEPVPKNVQTESPEESSSISVLESLQIPSPPPSSEPSTLTLEAQALVSQYEAFPFGRLSLADGTDSLILNSNLCNMGMLCEGPDGTIYYSLSRDHAIYQDSAEGSAREKILDQDADLLQFHEGKLYFVDKDTNLINSYDPVSRTASPMHDKKAGHFMLSGQSLYYVGEGGIYSYSLETGTNGLLVDTGRFTAIWTAMTEDILIYTLIDEEDPSFLSNALLFAYSFQAQTSYYIRDNVWMPLLAGSRVYYQNYTTSQLESLDLNSGETVSFGISTNRPGLDENLLYFHSSSPHQQLMSYNLSTSEIVSCFALEENASSVGYLCQTEDHIYLYLMNEQIYYYSKIDGSCGKL